MACRAERRRAGHPLRAVVQRARPGLRRGPEQRQQRLRTATRVPLQQLQTDHEAPQRCAASWGIELRRCARRVVYWYYKGLTADELKLLGTLGSVLPALGGPRASSCRPTACSSWRRGWARARGAGRALAPYFRYARGRRGRLGARRCPGTRCSAGASSPLSANTAIGDAGRWPSRRPTAAARAGAARSQ